MSRSKYNREVKKADPASFIKEEILSAGDALFYPKQGDTLSCHYKGMLQDGTVFDNSYDRGQTIFFILGSKQVIPGWEEVVQKMCRGQIVRATIPPDLGYGDKGFPPIIPPHATLIYEIELVSFSAVGSSKEYLTRDNKFDPNNPNNIL